MPSLIKTVTFVSFPSLTGESIVKLKIRNIQNLNVREAVTGWSKRFETEMFGASVS